MSREEDKELLSNLIFANKKFAENLEELKKLDGIASRAKAINDVDTSKILEQLDLVSFTQISRKIVDKLNEQLESQNKEVYKSAAAAQEAAKTLTSKAENLAVVADGFNNLDNMSQDLDAFTKKFKQMSVKSLYLGVIVATVVGIFAGGVLSYAYQFGTGDTSRWLEFASKTNAVIMPANAGGYKIFTPAAQSKFFLESNKDGADVLFIYPAEVK